ncbi:MAG TPA: hypothetical protein VMV77_03730 [Bacteroidales bacterium]|nr:hypothetical protein [Bacteroidales bacterium]
MKGSKSRKVKRSGNETADNQSLTINFVGDFLFFARFLPGFDGFYDN